MYLKSKGFLLFEAIIIIFLVSIISLSINKFIINISYVANNMHYQSKASLLVGNFITILKIKTSSADKHNLIEKFKNEVSLYLPNGKAHFSDEYVQINWLDQNKYFYSLKFRSSGFILIESLGYLFIINLILLSFLYLFNNFNNTYQLQTKLFLIDDSFNLVKSNIDNDLKNSTEVKIKDKFLYIKKRIGEEFLTIRYSIKKNLNKKLGLFRSENFTRFEEVVPYIESVSYSFYQVNTSQLLIIKLYAKIDNINDSTEIMLTL